MLLGQNWHVLSYGYSNGDATTPELPGLLGHRRGRGEVTCWGLLFWQSLVHDVTFTVVWEVVAGLQSWGRRYVGSRGTSGLLAGINGVMLRKSLKSNRGNHTKTSKCSKQSHVCC